MIGRIASRRQQSLTAIAYFVLALALLVLYSSANRPIWFDEMVTFTISGLPTIGEVLRQIYLTAPNLNQGTTGAYLVAEYVSVSAFGARWWSMRLPSLIAAAWALAALYVFLRAKRVHPIVIVATPILALAYPTLWYYAGEARTYMPLVAAVLGVLAYYSLSERQRQSAWGRTLGWGSVIIGVLFHPYFLLYWPALAVFCVWQMAWIQSKRIDVRMLLCLANPALVAVGLALGLTIGALTWMRGNIEQPVPWNQWLGSPLPKELLTTLFWPFMESGWLGVASAAILGTLALLNVASRLPRNQSLLPPMILLALAILLSLVVTAASVLADFWVFPRQWIASQAIVLATIPWIASMVISSGPTGIRTPWLPVAVAAGLLIPTMATTTVWKVSQLRQWNVLAEFSIYRALNEQQFAALLDFGEFPRDRVWMQFSQANLLNGGQAWETLGRYYTDKDWSSITLQQPAREDLFLEDVNP